MCFKTERYAGIGVPVLGGFTAVSYCRRGPRRRRPNKADVPNTTRDFFARWVWAGQRLRAGGYKLVMHAHDEVCAEIPIGQGSVEEFKRLLVEVPAWAQEMPIAAKVFECDRFKKD